MTNTNATQFACNMKTFWDMSNTTLKWSEVKWSGVTVKFLGTKAPCTLGWPYTEGTWLYCDYFIWRVSCAVVVLTCFVMCGCVYVGVFWILCGYFGNMCTCIYCVLYCLYWVFVLFRLCMSILTCFVCTSVRTAATELHIDCNNNNNNNNKTLVWTCSKISRNRSRRQGNHIVESTSTNWQNDSQQQTRHYNLW